MPVEGSAFLPRHLGVYLCESLCVSADVYAFLYSVEIILCQYLSSVGSIIAQVPGLQRNVAIQDPAVMQMN